MKSIVFRSFSLIVSSILLVSLLPISVSASQVTQPLVSVYSNHINDVASYEITFYTADTVDSSLDENDGDNILIQFPAGTTLPASISNSYVKINNQTLNQGIISIDAVTNTITLPLPNDTVLHRNSFVKIDIAQGAGIKNPGISGSYTIQAWTSGDTTIQTSAEYSILDSMITVPDVTVTPNIIGEVGAYMIDFNVSSNGNLIANADSIYLFFPLDTVLPASIDKANVKVNNISLTVNPTITNNPLITGDPDSRYRMEIKIPTTIQANDEVNIEISPNANIVHPTTQGDYFLEIWTSKDTVKNKSVGYEVAEAISDTTVWLSPDIAGQAGQYSIAIENGANQLEVDDTITIQFPTGTVFNNTSINNYVYIDGVKASDIPSANVVVNTSSLTMTINPQKQVAPGGVINILFTQNAGIQNPLKQDSSYFLNVKTTNDIAYRPSSTYSIQGNHITNLTTQLTNDGIGLNGEYLIQFTVSNFGGLVGGQDTVTIIFPNDTDLPSSLTYSAITVNDKPLTQNVTISELHRILQLTIPNDLTISRNGSVTIKFPQSVAIKNPSTVGSYTLDVYTSRDPVAIESSIPYIVGKQITTSTIAVSPNTYNTSAQYAIGFYTSDQGALSSAQNDYIEIVFPNGTVLPSYISASNIKINGINATSVSVLSMKLKIDIPSGMSISNSGYVGIVVDSLAGIKNPVGGTYQLKVSTSKDKSLVPSQSYATVGTSSTSETTTSSSSDNTASVEISSQLTSDIPNYEITYKTSSSGALEGGIDEISILFDSRIEIPGYISKETIKVNGVQVNSGWVRRDGQSIIFHLPTTVDISNNQTITITIDEQAEISNPALSGTYALYVTTSKDTTPAGASYTVGGSSGNEFIVTPQYNSDNSISKYTMIYTTGTSGSLKGGYDYVTIMIPITNTAELIDNISITANGYNVPSSQLEVSGKNLSFLLPYNVNIANSGQLLIIVEDPKHMTLPNTTGDVVFYLSTSKETSLTPSNSISILQNDLSDTNQESEEEEDETDESNQMGDINIKLYIGSKTAYVNGSTDMLLASPAIENNTTLVPLRFITESLGGYAEYRAAERRIVIIYEGDYLIFTLDSKTVYTKDDELELLVAPKIVNSTTLVPLRFIAEWMNIETIWNGNEKSITLKN